MRLYIIYSILILYGNVYSQNNPDLKIKLKKNELVKDFKEIKPYEENGGLMKIVSVNEMPILKSEKISFGKITLKPCQGIVPHTVKGASALLYVSKKNI